MYKTRKNLNSISLLSIHYHVDNPILKQQMIQNVKIKKNFARFDMICYLFWIVCKEDNGVTN